MPERDAPEGIGEPTPLVRCAVLGPLEVTGPEGEPCTPAGTLQRRLLAVLLLHRGKVVSADAIAEALWPGRLPRDHQSSVHTHVFRLRKRIPSLTIEHTPPGYVLLGDRLSVDADRFEDGATTGIALRHEDPAAAAAELDIALALWRGRPFEDLAESDDATIEAARLEEVWRRAAEERLAALLELGRADAIIADAEVLAAREPLRERPRELLMRALDATGRRAEALRVFDDVRRRLAEELGIDPSGHLRTLHDRILSGDTGSAPSPAPRGSDRDACRPPLLVRPLVGRASLAGVVDSALDRSRVVTLLGTGGVGKTSVAIDSAVRLAPRFPGGVCFVELAGSSPGAAGADVLAAMGAEPRAGVRPGRRVADLVGAEPVLLVLDNCEHVLDDVALLVEDAVMQSPQLWVLATSRERLAVAGEALVPVPPLRWNGADGPADAGDTTSLPPAVALFVERANDVGVPIELDEPTRLVVTEICRRLDGLPLAIELAAHRLTSLGLDEIRDGLDHSLRLLHGGRRAVSRHRSMTAALSWSYDLLDDRHRDLLAVLWVFASPFLAADAAAVAGRSTSEAQDVLAELVERSLVQRAEGRYLLLEPVRQFVHEEHTDEASRRLVADQHARHVTAVAEDLAQAVRSERAADAFARSRALVPDLRAAFRTAMAEADVDLAARVCLAVRDTAFHAMLPDPLAWAGEVAELAVATDHPSAPAMFGVAALGAWKAGDVDAAGRFLAAGVAEAERLSVQVPYFVTDMRATFATASGRLDEAIELYTAALDTSEGRDDPLWRSETSATLTAACGYRHDPDAAERAERLVGELLPAGCPVGQAWCWYGAGEAVLVDDPDLARARLARAVDIARATGAAFVEAVAGASLASLEVRHGEPTRAAAEYRWLLDLMQRGEAVAPLWTALRSVTELLVRSGIDGPAALLLGAVSATRRGQEPFGDDVALLGRLRQTLAERLGSESLERALASGAALDEGAATAVARAALDEITSEARPGRSEGSPSRPSRA